MWENLVGWLHLLWDAGKQTQDNRNDIRDLAQDHEDLTNVIRVLATQNELLRKDLEAVRAELAHERALREAQGRELELKLRLQLSEELRRLPPGGSTPS